MKSSAPSNVGTGMSAGVDMSLAILARPGKKTTTERLRSRKESDPTSR